MAFVYPPQRGKRCGDTKCDEIHSKKKRCVSACVYCVCILCVGAWLQNC